MCTLINEQYSQPNTAHTCPVSDTFTTAAYTSLSFSRWESFPFNYDSFGNAALVVFEVSSGEMWPDIMYATIDAVGPGEPMQKDYNRSSALYFIMVHLVISFLVRATRRESKKNRKRIERESKE